MIPRDYITAWRTQAPWPSDAQVEQDLVISRAIVELFSVREVASHLVFRGGTALYKIYVTPPARFGPRRQGRLVDDSRFRTRPPRQEADAFGLQQDHTVGQAD